MKCLPYIAAELFATSEFIRWLPFNGLANGQKTDCLHTTIISLGNPMKANEKFVSEVGLFVFYL